MRSTPKAKQYMKKLKSEVRDQTYREIARTAKEMAQRQLFPSIMYPHVKWATEKVTDKKYQEVAK